MKKTALSGLQKKLMGYLPLSQQDPHVNPVKLMAYSLSEDLGA